MPQLPLFPLNTVLFPGCRLPLQIFEQRYLRMVKESLKQAQGFVVVLISTGHEVGLAPDIFSVGTEAQIIDWNQLQNGLLVITVEGRARVQIGDTIFQDDGLLVGEVTRLRDTPQYHHAQIARFAELLAALEQHPLVQQVGLNVDRQELNALFWGLSGLLPFSNREKQYLLELAEPEMRVTALAKLLRSVEGGRS